MSLPPTRRERLSFGFTLVEMSVVLVIIGLLVGGVMAGQTLVRGAELKTVATDYTKYQYAVTQFRKQYGALPGDMIDATDYWGNITGNGNGNGRIGEYDFGDVQTYEIHRAWQHLAASGLLKGTFNGAGTGAALAPNVSEPGTRLLATGAWRFHYVGDRTADAVYFNGSYGNTVEVIGNDGATPILKPTEAWNIDLKLDDGLPGSGFVTSSENANCTASAMAYKVTNSANGCFLTFKLGL